MSEAHDKPTFDHIIRSFAAAWSQGERPSIDHVVAVEDEDRVPQLVELIREGTAAAPMGADAQVTVQDAGDTRAETSIPQVAGYEILGILGRGGMGVVYKARHLRLKRLVALKMILAGAHADDKAVARFRAEGEAVARLQHPNIVQIYEIGEQAHPYVALEYVDGGNLQGMLRGEVLPASQAAQLIETLARAMHFAHLRGVVHRDLKPANVLLTSDGVPKITDFGLAKQLDAEQCQTHSGAVMGTPNYMAPEQARGQVHAVGPHTDVYALGAILYQLITGIPPFMGETAMDTIEQVLHRDTTPPSRHRPVPRDLETICLKCLEKEPRRRYASAEDLAEDLRRFTAHESITARPATTLDRMGKWLRRHPTLATLAAACIVGSAGTSVVAINHIRAERRQELAAESRLEGARAEVRDLVDRGRNAVEFEVWIIARELVKLVDAKIEADPQLAGFKDDETLVRIKQRLQARGTYERFHRLRDEAIFRAALASGDSPGSNQSAAKEHTRAALNLVGMDAVAATLGKIDGAFSKVEHDDITASRYHLLLVYAELTAQRSPRQTPEAARKQAEAALEVLDQAAKVGAPTAAYHLRRARYLTQAGRSGADYERARAAELMPTSAADHYLLGEEHYHQGDMAAAVADFSEALQQDPAFFWARYFVSICYVRLGQPALARDNLTACLEQKDMIWIYLMRGFAHAQMESYAAAERDFNSALKRDPNAEAQYVLFNNRAMMHVGRRQYARAAADLQQAIALKPNQYQAYASLSQVYEQQQKTAEAREQLTRAIDAAQRLVDADDLDGSTLALLYRNRARLYLGLDEAPQAVADLRLALTLEPDQTARARTHADLGQLFLRADRFDEALRAYDEALSLQSKSAEAHQGRAEALFKLQRYDEAIRGFDAYFKHAGKPDGRVYHLRGLAKSLLRDIHGAIDDLTLALELRSKDGSLLCARAQLYVATHAYQLALRDFDDAVRLLPEDATALVGRGYVRAKLGQVHDAVVDADKATRIGPVTARLAHQAARVHALAISKLDVEGARLGGEAIKARRASQDRAFDLLRRSLSLVPAEQRATYWKDTIATDIDLNPIRRAVEFAQLERQYAPD